MGWDGGSRIIDGEGINGRGDDIFTAGFLKWCSAEETVFDRGM